MSITTLIQRYSRDQWLKFFAAAAILVIVGTGAALTNWVSVVMCGVLLYICLKKSV